MIFSLKNGTKEKVEDSEDIDIFLFEGFAEGSVDLSELKEDDVLLAIQSSLKKKEWVVLYGNHELANFENTHFKIKPKMIHINHSQKKQILKIKNEFQISDFKSLSLSIKETLINR